MKRKKVLSTAVAGALVAAQMAMPVMAADGGSLDVDVTTKTGVLRVEVPTNMAIAVDQFEITQTGAQIASGTFDMTNKSEVNVKVAVTSTVELGDGITLASAKDAVKGNEAWLGVAAKTAANSYDDLTTDDSNDPNNTGGTNTLVEDYWDLSEKNANVTSFARGEARQTFYLEKGTGTVEYKMAQADASAAMTVQSYAQLFELTALTPTSNDDAGLQAEVDKGDVYYVVTADIGEGATVKKIAKGTTVAGSADAYASINTYYTAAAVATPIGSATASTSYVYAAMNTAGGAAAFTYVGKLSNEKETWTSEDIKKVSIAYTITGVTASNYDDVKSDCTYGLYGVSGPQFSVDEKGLITITGLTAAKNYQSVVVNGASIEGGDAEWDTANWTEADGGDVAIQLGSSWMDWLDGQSVTSVITYTDGTTAQSTVVFAK